MRAQGVPQADLGKLVGRAQPDVQRLSADRVGTVPESWQWGLNALGPELIAVPRKEGRTLDVYRHVLNNERRALVVALFERAPPPWKARPRVVN